MADRYLDLLKQGFMKPSKAPRRLKAERAIVSCMKCRDWHREGKHVSKEVLLRRAVAAGSDVV